MKKEGILDIIPVFGLSGIKEGQKYLENSEDFKDKSFLL